ncbi:hypothetical protein [Zymobacter sp. IVIA_5232.4 C2]|uniref:hypothetical protein n=1 Tax=Zymobacter sp. IVIA_5232.4 C2 TaxID=3394855 RepID=UPI0039C2AF75
MQNRVVPFWPFSSLIRSLAVRAVCLSIGLLLTATSQAASWDISEDVFDAAQGGVQVKGRISADEDPEILLGGYACRGCQNANPFIFLYLPEGRSGDAPYPITVNGRQIMVQGESSDNPDVVTDQIPVDTNDVNWWAQQVVRDVPLTVSLDGHVWHFANRNGHRFAR